MESSRIKLVLVAILVPFLFLSFLSSFADANGGTVSTTVTDFCKNRKDNEFCLQTFRSDPRSATAKDTGTLLKICVESAVTNAKESHKFLVGLSTMNIPDAISEALKPVVTACESAYDSYVSMLNGVVGEFKDDPMTASYDGMLALAELGPCNVSLAQSKITQHQIFSSYKTASDYCMLCVDVANAGEKN